jgi:hypothetical protein
MVKKFIVDTMLGKLGRWMLHLGYDVLYFRGKDDRHLLEAAEREGRIIITRDTHLVEEHPHADIFLIRTLDFWEQLRCVVREFPMNFGETLFSRCSHCNVPVERMKTEEARAFLPPKARERATMIFRCPLCNKLYWDGTHPIHIIQLLREHVGLDVGTDKKQSEHRSS